MTLPATTICLIAPAVILGGVAVAAWLCSWVDRPRKQPPTIGYPPRPHCRIGELDDN